MSRLYPLFAAFALILLAMPAQAKASPASRVTTASLETGLSLAHRPTLDEHDRRFAAWIPSVYLGLGWTPNPWFSIHGALQVAWLAALDGDFSYRTHNRALSTSHFGGIGLYAAFDVHPPSRLLALRVALQARTYFTRARAGILDISGGCGLFARPIASPSVQPVFGVTAWFPVYDDFETLFGRETQLPVLELSVGFAF